MGPLTEKELLDDGFQWLSSILAEGTDLQLAPYFGDERDHGYDAWWQVREDGSSFVGTILVEAKVRVTPRTVEQLKGFLTPARVHQMNNPTVLILAPWLSPRSRELIAGLGWSYLDLTGNVLLRSKRPAIFVRLTGAQADPFPRERNDVQLRGDRINSLVRLLADVEPPYRLSELAAASHLSQGYVSRALTALHDQGLIDREGSGPVTRVDWEQLLRTRAAEYDLLNSNKSGSYLARSGPAALLRQLPDDPQIAVTGSFAAYPISPVAPPSQLALYVNSPKDFGKAHDLLPTRSGANVLLLQPASASQLSRTRLVDGARHVGYSQLVQDLLGGNGRLPEEGEAVLQWMIDTPGWRLPRLPAEDE